MSVFYLAGVSSQTATLKRLQVKNAGGILQGSPLLKTGFQRRGDGVAERDLSPAPSTICILTSVIRSRGFLLPKMLRG